MCEQLNLDVLTFQDIYLDSMNRISEYDFVEKQDFTTVTKNLVNGGRSIDYYITLDMD